MLSALSLFGFFWLASAPSAAQPAANGPERWLVVPLDPKTVERLPQIYSSLEVLGAKTVDGAERLGTDERLNTKAQQPARVDDVRAALLEAKAALRKLDILLVEKSLQDALTRFLHLATPDAERDLLGDILLMRAELLLATNRSAEAEEELRLLARIDAERAALHPGLHGPALVQAFADARVKNQNAELGTLVLLPRTVRDEEIRITVDGASISVGTFPLPAGPHLVTASLSVAPTRSWIVRIEADRPTLLDPFLAPSGAAEERERLLRQLQSDYAARSPGAWHAREDVMRELARWTGAHVVVALGEQELWVMRAHAGMVQGPFAIKNNEPMACAGAALSGVTATANVREAPRVSIGTSTNEDLETRRAIMEKEAGANWMWWTVGTASLSIVFIGGALLAYGFWPAADIPRPPQPIVVTCCNKGNR